MSPSLKDRCVKAMYSMEKEERMGPGGLDPVEAGAGCSTPCVRFP